MGYGHAERNLALIRQLEAETRELLGTLDQPDPEQSAWLQEVTRWRAWVHREGSHGRRGTCPEICRETTVTSPASGAGSAADLPGYAPPVPRSSKIGRQLEKVTRDWRSSGA